MTTARKNVSVVQSFRQASESRAATERRLAELGIGILMALEEGRGTAAEAARDLFNMDSYQAARRLRLSPDLLEFVAWGMELEDVDEFAPAAKDESFERMKQLVRRVLEDAREPAAAG